ncbi:MULTISPECIES: TetR/AcrR family transcriptional regulator [unclassified Mycobacterium]|uniref:TetR/AcrR family transcriptional regulator n=1 Tax=unclassified Mycobacterium TaxID=2642494 RepID=UPI0029C89374|nr:MULTISPECIES: TetR/AcrR family transcriptional regulator [unclassified Mycobacterium]
MTSDEAAETPLPRALELLWRGPNPARRASGLTRERIVTAAIELADADGLSALSMARLAERLGCGTMSLYRHVANKDELVVFMLSEAPAPPPAASDDTNWRDALSNWANGLWDVYHQHPWILAAASSGPPADPGQLAWLDAGLGTMAATPLAERDKLAAVIAVLHFVRGAAALDLEAGSLDATQYPALLRRLMDPARFPALAAALTEGVFDDADDDPRSGLDWGVRRLLDGIGVEIATANSDSRSGDGAST